VHESVSFLLSSFMRRSVWDRTDVQSERPLSVIRVLVNCRLQNFIANNETDICSETCDCTVILIDRHYRCYVPKQSSKGNDIMANCRA